MQADFEDKSGGIVKQQGEEIIFYAADIIGSQIRKKNDKILVDNYRDYPARTSSIWNLFRSK